MTPPSIGDDETDTEFAERLMFALRDIPASEQIPFLAGALMSVSDDAYRKGYGAGFVDGVRSERVSVTW